MKINQVNCSVNGQTLNQTLEKQTSKIFMPKIQDIPVVVVGGRTDDAATDGPASSIVLALLNEIEAKLDALVTHGEESTIDLIWLKRMPQELELLRNLLGEGEVSANINSFGISRVQETAVPCVWWVSHRDFDGSRQGELIEITEIPDLLRSDRLSIKKGLADLRTRREQIELPHQFSSM